KCRLLILTHLDADHFGGLQALVSDHLNRRLSEPVQWPDFIWVNDFEPRDIVNSVLSCVGEVPETVGESRATLSKLIDAADAWRDKTDGDVRSMRGVDAPLETELVIEADPESFRYLASTAPVPWLRYLQTEMKMLIALYEIVQELEKLPLSGLQKLTQLADEITKAYQ